MAKSRLQKGSAFAAATIALVGGFEGLRTYAYRDPIGVPTLCFGETRGVHMGDHKTVEECKAMLGDRLREFETEMTACLRNPASVPDNAYISFLSLSYNIGTSAFCKSSVARRANNGDFAGACDAIMAFNKARIAGVLVPLPGLTKRRAMEREFCLAGL